MLTPVMCIGQPAWAGCKAMPSGTTWAVLLRCSAMPRKADNMPLLPPATGYNHPGACKESCRSRSGEVDRFQSDLERVGGLEVDAVQFICKYDAILLFCHAFLVLQAVHVFHPLQPFHTRLQAQKLMQHSLYERGNQQAPGCRYFPGCR